MKIITISALALGTVALAACQPTASAQTVAMDEDLSAIELQQLDTNNDGRVDQMEMQRIADVADNGVNTIPDAQLVTVDDN